MTSILALGILLLTTTTQAQTFSRIRMSEICPNEIPKETCIKRKQDECLMSGTYGGSSIASISSERVRNVLSTHYEISFICETRNLNF
jgi:hypothetical protein